MEGNLLPHIFVTGVLSWHWITPICGQTMASDSGEAPESDWMFIFAMVCFALGAVLVLFGILRLIYFFMQRSKEKKRLARANEPDPVRNYYNSPWLKGNTFAQSLTRSPTRGDDDVLRGVDVNSFYATPHDQTDGQLSPTSRNFAARSKLSNGGVLLDDPIYSVPHNHNQAALNSDEIETHAQYTTPDKPKKFVVRDADPQVLQIQRLQEQQELTMNIADDALQRSMSSDHTLQSNDTQAVLSALDAATAEDDSRNQKEVGNGMPRSHASHLGSPSRHPTEPYSHYDTIPAARSPPLSPTYSGSGVTGARVVNPSDLEVSLNPREVLYDERLGSNVMYMDPRRQASTLAYIDRTLAEENEIEYKFSSSVYVHSL